MANAVSAQKSNRDPFTPQKIKEIIRIWGPLKRTTVDWRIVITPTGSPAIDRIVRPPDVNAEFPRREALKRRLNRAANDWSFREACRVGEFDSKSPEAQLEKIEDLCAQLLSALSQPQTGPTYPPESWEKFQESVIGIRRISAWSRKAREALLSGDENSFQKWNLRLDELISTNSPGAPPRRGYYPRKIYLMEVIDVWARILDKPLIVGSELKSSESGDGLMDFAEYAVRQVLGMQPITGQALRKTLNNLVGYHQDWIRDREQVRDAFENFMVDFRAKASR